MSLDVSEFKVAGQYLEDVPEGMIRKHGRIFLKPRFGRLKNADRLEVISHYSHNTNSCACCGESVIEFLTVHHINNDGKEHRAQTGAKTGGKNFYRWLVKNRFPENPPLSILCYNCNNAIEKYGKCPHQV